MEKERALLCWPQAAWSCSESLVVVVVILGNLLSSIPASHSFLVELSGDWFFLFIWVLASQRDALRNP